MWITMILPTNKTWARMSQFAICVLGVFCMDVFAKIERTTYLPGGSAAQARVEAYIHNSIDTEVLVIPKRAGSDADYASRRIRVELLSPTNEKWAMEIETDHRGIFSYKLKGLSARGPNEVRKWAVVITDADAAGNPEVTQRVDVLVI